MNKNVFKIGCFGALRPFKNHLQQALWAIKFSKNINRKLEFHINASEKDENNSVLLNLRAVLTNSGNRLVEHSWMPHPEFLNLVKSMDMGLQLSFTETFNIVAADFVYCNIPIVVSNEISWVHWLYKANPYNPTEVLAKMYIAYYGKLINLHKINNKKLDSYNKKSLKIWTDYINTCD